MDLTFKIDFQYDLEMLLEFSLDGDGGNKEKNIERISELTGMDTEELEEMIKEERTSDTEQIFKKTAERKYQKIQPFMENSLHLYQSSWSKILKEFTTLVEEKTNASWKYKDYYCVVSAFHQGISNWGGNTIVRKWSIHPDVQRPVTAHELVLSHFWTILDEHLEAGVWEDEEKWKYCEIFSWCLLGLEKEFHKFWPWLLAKDRWPLDHNYPEIIPLQKKIGAMHGEYDNFREFLEGVLKVKKAQ
jgi:hypothetical protein